MNKTIEKTFASRLVTLPGGTPGLRSGLTVKVATPTDADDEAILDFIASDETVDRYGEVILASGWELERYRHNPVFQNCHQYGDVVFTLGRALATEVRQTGGRPFLYQRIRFAVEANPMAKIAHALYRGKYLNAVSVGFVPLEWQEGAEAHPASRKYLRQELLEVSAVSIPANPNALALAAKAGAVALGDLRELEQILRCAVREREMANPAGPSPFCSHQTDPAANVRASGGGIDEARWLQLSAQLFALREALKKT
jgi:uncharacterized protein